MCNSWFTIYESSPHTLYLPHGFHGVLLLFSRFSCFIHYFRCDMAKHELRVTSLELQDTSYSWKLKSTSRNSNVRVQIHELLVQLHELRLQIHELRVQIHELRVKTHEFKNHLINENSSKQPCNFLFL